MGNGVLHKGEVVTVLRKPLGRWPVFGRMPQLGETGRIRYVLGGLGVIYGVDHHAANGNLEWLCEFAQDDVELKPS